MTEVWSGMLVKELFIGRTRAVAHKAQLTPRTPHDLGNTWCMFSGVADGLLAAHIGLVFVLHERLGQNQEA